MGVPTGAVVHSRAVSKDGAVSQSAEFGIVALDRYDGARPVQAEFAELKAGFVLADRGATITAEELFERLLRFG